MGVGGHVGQAPGAIGAQLRAVRHHQLSSHLVGHGPAQCTQNGLQMPDVPLECPLKGHSLWDLTLIMPGLARKHLFYSIPLHFADARGTHGQTSIVPVASPLLCLPFVCDYNLPD